MRGKKKLVWIVPAALLGIALFIFIGGELVMRLWNWLTPALFGWRQVTFWQAVGILALCRILVGGHGLRGPVRSNIRRRIRERMAERWEHMTPEERERFRQGMGGRCGMGHTGSGPSTPES
ncbi:MAG: hypothetical protein WA738_10555 [Candidatus Angelobacter sp.]